MVSAVVVNQQNKELDNSKAFVSRAGLKLDHALKEFRLDVKGLTCADFGCNLGGFTDCLLQQGTKKVYAVDTSKNCLEYNLRSNPKVVIVEQTNAMHVKLPEKMDLIVSDVAWTKQERILPAIKQNLKEGGLAISLIKPHYEAHRLELTRGKVNEDALPAIIERVENIFTDNGFELIAITKSPITGRSGKNTEYLALLKKILYD